MYIVTVSPKGQITIPKAEREKCKQGKYALIVKGENIILRPIEVKITGGKETDNELVNFAALAEHSFSFWDNEEDDIYQQFYQK